MSGELGPGGLPTSKPTENPITPVEGLRTLPSAVLLPDRAPTLESAIQHISSPVSSPTEPSPEKAAQISETRTPIKEMLASGVIPEVRGGATGMDPEKYGEKLAETSQAILNMLQHQDFSNPDVRRAYDAETLEFAEEYQRLNPLPPPEAPPVIAPEPAPEEPEEIDFLGDLLSGADTGKHGEPHGAHEAHESHGAHHESDEEPNDFKRIEKELHHIGTERVETTDAARRRTIEQIRLELDMEKLEAKKAELLKGRTEDKLKKDEKEELEKINQGINQVKTGKDSDGNEVGGSLDELEAEFGSILDRFRNQAAETERGKIAGMQKRWAKKKEEAAEAKDPTFDLESIPDLDEADFKAKYEAPQYIPDGQIVFTDEENTAIGRLETRAVELAEEKGETIEFLASPERGIEIAKVIMHWEGMRKAGLYKEINWEELDEAYEDEIIFVEAARLISKRERVLSRSAPPKEFEIRDVDVKELDKVPPLETLYKQFYSGEPLSPEFYKDLDVYFGEAKAAGMLRDMEQRLTTAYGQVAQGLDEGLSVTEILSAGSQQAQPIQTILEPTRATAAEFFDIRQDRDSNLSRLVVGLDDDKRLRGVWDLYLDIAIRRLKEGAHMGDIDYAGDMHRNFEKNEFKPDPNLTETQERYWRPSAGGWSIDVTARTPAQYDIAADTYITDVQARTSDPSEAFQEGTQFIQQITRSTGHHTPEFIKGLREAKGGAEDKTNEQLVQEFLKDLATRIQARLGVRSADHSNELYHGGQYKQSMDYMAKDGEGPKRWLALMQIPYVAEAVWKLENDPRFEMIYAMYGSHGQLASDTVAQRGNGVGLHNQVISVLTEEVMGTRIVNEAYRQDVANDMSEAQFAKMFDGLYEYGKIKVGGFQGDANINVYKKYGDLEPDQLRGIPKADREAYKLGRVQYLLQPVNSPGGGGGLTHHQLSKEDKAVLAKAEAQVEKAVEIALEIAGAMGEKSKRGGGVVKVGKEISNPRDGEPKHYDFVAIHQGEKFVQMAESTTEIKYADDAEFWRKGIPDRMKDDPIGKKIIDSNRKKAIETKKGVPDLENFKARYRAAMVAIARDKALEEFAGVEWILGRDGKPDHVITPEEKKIMSANPRDLSPEQRMKLYGDDEKKIFALNAVRIGGKGFESKLYEYEYQGNRLIQKDVVRVNRPLDVFDFETGETRSGFKGTLLGYDENGVKVTLNYGADGVLMLGDVWDKDGRAKLYDSPPASPGSKDHRQRVNFHFSKDSRVIEKEITVINADTGNREKRITLVQQAEADFALANNHLLGDWTSHTYWGYQEEDRHMILAPQSFAEARQIRDGTLRPEDASIWGRQLLLLDPTLLRVMRFAAPGSKQEDHERKLAMAAVEHKYQSHWRISRELHRAFFPTLATPVRFNGLYYGLQDFGGFRKMLESARAQIGEDEERFSRRGKRLTPDLHIPYASAAEMWGVGSQGVMGVMRLLNAPLYKAVGTMALDKFANQAEVADKLRSALVEGRDGNGGYQESLLLKLTNNSDKVSAEHRGDIPGFTEEQLKALQEELLRTGIKQHLKRRSWMRAKSGISYGEIVNQNKFAYTLIESLGRYDKYLKLFPLMETSIRNAPGAFWFAQDEKSAVDIFIEPPSSAFYDGLQTQLSTVPSRSLSSNWNKTQFMAYSNEARKIQREIEREFTLRLNLADIDDAGSPFTGSGRHSAKIFHDTFGGLLVDQGPRGGGQLYKGERFFYARIYDRWMEYDENGEAVFSKTENMWDFIFGKLVPT